jgi:pimeloyl-ACP methyl ester carboxylesterase
VSGINSNINIFLIKEIIFYLGTMGLSEVDNDLIYIGHSMGTSALFVMLSELPEYNEKIKLFIALAPVAYMTQ